MSHNTVSGDEEKKRFLILGTNCGFVSCFLETSFIDDEPSFSLIKNEEVLASLDRAGTASRADRPECKVLFSLCLGGMLIAISYSDGSTSMWDLDRAQLVFEFDVKSTGIVLACMQK